MDHIASAALQTGLSDIHISTVDVIPAENSDEW
jgi:hypothetical protein